ncbi:hypothetical protein WA1_23555 [Scytonema hofmannii PCC 7110]|uniref:Filamentous haemagglutinin FhaB/tRNA nuclease CdiA-like TPS domain-containing protein n=1 Tax=Scytonema hofmannii PCC 7110 TaxID=128403 RepID=A0A139X8R3_9CYAN|nr:filamentous hemagglutinin N-terminal domain-containing protein [Scytonema hofmannii]KYC41094.1 hypothetical protein WA1_23555 [Scytonema hofmannii PCC 7110]
MSTRWRWFLRIAICGTSIFSANCALAQITPDSTLPNNSSVTREGSTFNITGGTQAGSNLFHSFGEFSAPNGGTAFFNNAVDIQNIISRVTGKSISNIDGLIRANGTANLFLINPNGIIFGQNARLDIGGSFLASTASSLEFSDGFEFNATSGQTTSLLTISAPIGLQYGRNPGGNILNQSSAFNSSGDPVGLQVQSGKTLALVSSEVNLDDGILFAPGGRVELGGLVGEGTVGLNVNGNNLSLSFPDSVARANVSLTNGSEVDVTAGGGGNIVVNAQNLNILGGSKLLAGIGESLGLVGSVAGDITLNATGAIKIEQSSRIENNVNLDATGNGGSINIQGRSLSMTDGARLRASTVGQGSAGSISIHVEDEVSLSSQSYIDSSANYLAMGNGGNIQIKAGSLTMSEAQLSASTTRSEKRGVPPGQGNGGNISVQIEGAVSLKDSSIDSIVGSRTVGNGGDIHIKAGSLTMADEAIVTVSTDGRGNAGNISVQVEDELSLTTSYINSFVNFFGENYRAVGDGGDIHIEAGSLLMTADPRLRVKSGAQISSGTFGTGNAGNISVQVKDTVSLSGYSYISSGVSSTAKGDGGDIQIKAGSLLMTDDTGLSTITDGLGDAGNISVQVKDAVSLTDSSIGSQVGFFKAEGDGGNIYLEAESLFMTDGARLNASTVGQGAAGNIQINASDSVSISGVQLDGLPYSSGLFTNTVETATGQSGDIVINTDALRISDRALLSTQTRNAFRGGNITVNAKTLEVTSGGQLLTTAFSSGKAGDITVNSTDSITISGSAPTPTFGDQFAISDSRDVFSNDSPASGLFVRVQGNEAANAGDIKVTARSIRLDNKGTLSAETTFGEGGNIILNVRDILLLRNNSSITATAGTAQQDGGNGGNITINAPNGFIVANPNGNNDITANAFTGSGGKITINATNIFGITPLSRQELEKLRPDLNSSQLLTNDITAISRTNPSLSGTIELNTPDIDPNSSLVNLPSVPVDTEVAQSCTAGGTVAKSQFIITGRGGLPPNAGETLSTDAVQVDLITLNSRSDNRNSPSVTSKTTTAIPERIVEATGWMRNEKGEVVFIAHSPITTPQSPWFTQPDCRAS